MDDHLFQSINRTLDNVLNTFALTQLGIQSTDKLRSKSAILPGLVVGHDYGQNSLRGGNIKDMNRRHVKHFIRLLNDKAEYIKQMTCNSEAVLENARDTTTSEHVYCTVTKISGGMDSTYEVGTISDEKYIYKLQV